MLVATILNAPLASRLAAMNMILNAALVTDHADEIEARSHAY